MKRKRGTYPATDRLRRSRRGLGRHRNRHHRPYRQHTKQQRRMNTYPATDTRRCSKREQGRHRNHHRHPYRRHTKEQRKSLVGHTADQDHPPGLHKCFHRIRQRLQRTNPKKPTHMFLQGHNTSRCTMTRILRCSTRQRSIASYRHTDLQVHL
jgi:hypothetical protein